MKFDPSHLQRTGICSKSKKALSPLSEYLFEMTSPRMEVWPNWSLVLISSFGSGRYSSTSNSHSISLVLPILSSIVTLKVMSRNGDAAVGECSFHCHKSHRIVSLEIEIDSQNTHPTKKTSIEQA